LWGQIKRDDLRLKRGGAVGKADREYGFRRRIEMFVVGILTTEKATDAEFSGALKVGDTGAWASRAGSDRQQLTLVYWGEAQADGLQQAGFGWLDPAQTTDAPKPAVAVRTTTMAASLRSIGIR
jgi:hypothetical protein